MDRYGQVLDLHDQGLTTADIGSRIGLSGRTVQRWLAHGSWTFARPRRRRPSLIDPYERYVLQWWQEGNRNGLQLYRELRAQGYRGSSKAVYRYLERLRTPQRHSLGSSSLSKFPRRKRIPASPAPLENFSAKPTTWLFMCQPEKVDQRQQAELSLIRQTS